MKTIELLKREFLAAVAALADCYITAQTDIERDIITRQFEDELIMPFVNAIDEIRVCEEAARPNMADEERAVVSEYHGLAR